jgi:metal-responsive CopG/Arc/MetJ family transcriptional regulator
MRRVQIYIDEDLDDSLRQVAALEGRPAAAVIRDAVRAYIESRRHVPKDDPFRSIIGAYSGGPDDAAQDHDRYLYGEDLDGERRA